MLIKIKEFLHGQSGSITMIAAGGIVVFIGFVALALDIGHMMLVKNELQRAADAGALAGARGLWPNDLKTITSTTVPNCSQARTRALDTTKANVVDGANPDNVVSTDDVVCGIWDYAQKTFTASTSNSTNAVKVTTQRNDVAMYFASILGIGPKNISATAVAIIDWVGGVGKGTLPIAIGEQYVPKKNQTLIITFNPSTSDVGGWFTAPNSSSNASTLESYIDNGECPPLKIYDSNNPSSNTSAPYDRINLNNGVIDSVLQALVSKASNGQSHNSWSGQIDVALPTVDSTQFNENMTPIKGFIDFQMTRVDATGNNKRVEGVVKNLGMGPQTSTPGGGGNAAHGLLASPRLVNFTP
jgi:Flp pilus assembly protein TadG